MGCDGENQEFGLGIFSLRCQTGISVESLSIQLDL